MRAKIGLLVFIVATLIGISTVQADDGIPDNCEYAGAPHYRANIFPRYEPQNRRLLLVDWTTGADMQVIATDLGETRIMGWSADCRYLAGAVGSSESMATVVWDTVENRYIGEVLDAHKQPHPITWGPGNYLVVETRNGAILWNVPANTQITLTTSFNTFTARNFSRLRWDAAHNQLIANLAVGGRVVYDLTTGQEVPEAAATFNAPAEQTSIVIAGQAYECQSRIGINDERTQTSYVVSPKYDITTRTISLVISDYYTTTSDEVILVLEDNLIARNVHFRGYSANCRYLAASLYFAGGNSSDTVVWDVIERRRVGTFEDARLIEHPIHWDKSGDSLMIETRNGAYLWHLPTDTRTLLTSVVQTALSGSSSIRTFYSLEWLPARGELLMITVENPYAVTIYNAQNGAQVGVYPSALGESPIKYRLSPDASQILIYVEKNDIINIWDRSTGSQILLTGASSGRYGRTFAISPDNRYLASSNSNSITVWDLHNLQVDNSPNWTYPTQYGYPIVFLDNTTLRLSESNNLRLNVSTGEINQDEPSALSPVAPTPVEGTSGGRSLQGYFSTNGVCNNLTARYSTSEGRLTVYDFQSQEIRVVAENLNRGRILGWSQNCRYLIGEISFVNRTLPYDTAPIDDTRAYSRGEILVFWDVITGGEIAAFPNPRRSWTRQPTVWWSPDGNSVMIRVTSGQYLLHLNSRQSTLLTFNNDGRTYLNISPSPNVYWDYARGQIYLNTSKGVTAFDMLTGNERYSLSGRRSFIVAPDNLTLIQGWLTIWNLDTLENIQFDNEGFGDKNARVALSPDRRYLVITDDMIGVWDLTHLAADIEMRDPIYTYAGPNALIQSVRFIDNVTIETTSAEGVQRWNVETGELVSETP